MIASRSGPVFPTRASSQEGDLPAAALLAGSVTDAEGCFALSVAVSEHGLVKFDGANLRASDESLPVDVISRDVQRCSRLPLALRRFGCAFNATRRHFRDSTVLFRTTRDRDGTTQIYHQAPEQTRAMVRLRMVGVAIGSAAVACLATPAMAENKPSTRLVSCGTDSCLLVTGHRQSADAEVRINGHHVVVQGERSWRVRLPVSTVRDWSAPFARKIEVSSYDPAIAGMASHSAKLPIGLLGHVPDLASLVITLN